MANTLIKELTTICECGISEEYILNKYFELCKNQNKYVFRCSLIGYRNFNSSQLVEHLRVALQGNRIVAGGTEVAVTRVCLNEEECNEFEATESTSIGLAMLLSSIVCIGIILVVILIVSIVLCICYRKNKKMTTVNS